MIYLACRDWLIERRGVTSCDHGSKISRSQQSFLTEMAIGIVERWKKSMGSRLCNHAQESHASFFFCHICRTMLPWQHNVTTSSFYRFRCSFKSLTVKYVFPLLDSFIIWTLIRFPLTVQPWMP